jgi:hypothetical protein
MAHEGKLRKINRLITTHGADGKAVFSTAVPEESKMEALPDNMGFALRYDHQLGRLMGEANERVSAI